MRDLYIWILPLMALVLSVLMIWVIAGRAAETKVPVNIKVKAGDCLRVTDRQTLEKIDCCAPP